MKVFISWSGNTSKSYAEAIDLWLPDVLQDVEPFLSNKDIEKGTFWATQLTQALVAHAVGILCVTPSNTTAPWLHFEAGALIRGLTKTHVCPILFEGLKPTDIKGPLSLLQFTLPTSGDMLKLVKTINNAAENPLPVPRIERAFEKWWPNLEKQIGEITKTATTVGNPSKRDPSDMLIEILEICRVLRRNQAVPAPPLSPAFFNPFTSTPYQDLLTTPSQAPDLDKLHAAMRKLGLDPVKIPEAESLDAIMRRIGLTEDQTTKKEDK